MKQMHRGPHGQRNAQPQPAPQPNGV
jgi:hypothetical protein